MRFIILAFVLGLLIFPVVNAYGHGLGLETISNIEINGKKVDITVELPLYFEAAENKQLTITIEDNSDDEIHDITLLVSISHDGEKILSEQFFSPNRFFAIDVEPTNSEEIVIQGEQNSHNAWYSTDTLPLKIIGPIFDTGGLYNFEIEIKTYNDPITILDFEPIVIDISMIETASFEEKDEEGNNVQFRMRSYFDNISNFNYDPQNKIVSFEMPFDWTEPIVSHIPLVHEEVHFPKDFSGFSYPSYIGKVNGIELFKSSVSIDDYTEESERIVHFVLLQDHIRFLKNEIKKSGEELPDSMVFTLSSSDKIQFPMMAWTKNEEFRVDLSWDPIQIEPGKNTKFIFTIRDALTEMPLRNSSYDFVIIQNGVEIHRITGNAQIGGGFEEFVFAEKQTGPTIIRFENIRGTGNDTEFSLVVVPEFSEIAVMILLVGMISILAISKRSRLESVFVKN